MYLFWISRSKVWY